MGARKRLRSAARSLWLAIMVLLGGATQSALAQSGVDVRFGNDIGSGNEFTDDHYTATVTLRVAVPRFGVLLEERMFTDHASGHRFDETQAGIELHLPPMGAWSSRVGLGALHVGRGILGEQAQNGLHGWIGNDPVDLAYPARNTVRPYGAYGLFRDFGLAPSLTLEPMFQAWTAPGFRSSLHGSVGLTWKPHRTYALFSRVGYRIDRVDYTTLQPWASGRGATLSFGMQFFDGVGISWTRNEYGLDEHHWNLALRIPAPWGTGK